MRTAVVLVATLLAGHAPAADLAKIDRTIAREPAYQFQPRYCLLVFGPRAKSRVWLVRDGHVLYVDRNGNGDLTEKGERYAGDPLARVPRGPGSIRWHVGDVVEVGGRARHTDLRVRFERDSFLLSLRTADGMHQEVGNEVGPLRFSDRAPDAPVVHLVGPLTFLLRGERKKGEPLLDLVPGKEAHFIALVGTAGLGEGAAAYCHTAAFAQLKMVGEVEFRRRAGAAPLRARCRYDGY